MTTPRCLLDKSPQSPCVLPSWPVVGNFMQTNLFFFISSIFSFIKLVVSVDSSLCVLTSNFSDQIYQLFFSFVKLISNFQVFEGQQWWNLHFGIKFSFYALNMQSFHQFPFCQVQLELKLNLDHWEALKVMKLWTQNNDDNNKPSHLNLIIVKK